MMWAVRQLPVVSRLREERGFTLVEVLVATVVMAIALVGLFGALDVANKVSYTNRERQAATSLAREVVEQARSLPYTSLNTAALASALQPLIPGATVSGQTLTVTTRRAGVNGATAVNYTFSVSFNGCSMDDPTDGIGDHSQPPASGGVWCADVAGSGSTDSQPDDYKRVAVSVNQTGPVNTAPVQQTVAIYNRPVNGPAASCLTVAGNGCPGTPAYVQTGAQLTFDVTTTSPASAIQWLVNGNPPPAAQLPIGADDPYSLGYGSTTSQFTWMLPQADGTYTISVIAYDANGNSGTVTKLQVVVNRHMVLAPASMSAIYNRFIGGVDVQWVPSIDQDVLYYQVLRNGTTVVCQTTGTSCTDLTATAPPPIPPGCTWYQQNSAVSNYTVVGFDTNPPPGSGPRQSNQQAGPMDANGCENPPSPPTGLTGTLTNGVLNLGWNAPNGTVDQDSGDKVAAWRVYRWGPSGAAFPGPGSQRLADRQQLVGSGTPPMSVTSATDNAPDPGGAQQNYCVTSVDLRGNESACSNTVVG